MFVLRAKVRIKFYIRKMHGPTINHRFVKTLQHSFDTAGMMYAQKIEESKRIVKWYLRVSSTRAQVSHCCVRFYFRVKKLQMYKYRIFALRNSRFNFMVSQLQGQTEFLRDLLKQGRG